MTDETRPPSPGETPGGGMDEEITTQTTWDAGIRGEPGIADDLGPEGGPARDDLARAEEPFGSEDDFVADDPATTDTLGLRGRTGGDEQLAPIDPDAAENAEMDTPSVPDEDLGSGPPGHGGH